MGQEFNLEFPTHLKVNPNESVDGIRLRFGTSTELIQTTKETSHPLTEASMLEELDLDSPPCRPRGGTQIQTNETSVSIQQGHSFIAVLEFL
jgi:hypothetical protein